MDISHLVQVQMNDVHPTTASETDSMNIQGDIVKPSEIVSEDEMLYYQRIFGNDIAQVRFKKLHCTACDGHIGSALSEASNMQEHPILKTLLCSSCRDFYGDGNFEQGDDATDMFCRWCANGGNLYCCSYCSNTFCDKCIKRNFEPDVRNKIEADEKWKCFVCDPTDLYMLRALCRALLQHVKTLARILMADRTMNAKDIEAKMELDDSKCCIGRRSRRKRHGSSSEDDPSSRSRSPSQKRNRKNHHWSNKKRRNSSVCNDKSNFTVLNGTSRFIPIAPRFVLQEMVPSTIKYRNEEDEIPAPLLNCEQTMIEGENETVTPQGVVLPANTQSKIPESILYNSAISLNPLPTQNVIRGPVTQSGKMIPIRPLRKINSLSLSKTSQVIQPVTYSARPNAPMVAIPSILHPKAKTNTSLPVTPTTKTSSAQPSNYLRCKKNLTSEPNIIDLESDTEDLIIVEGQSMPNDSEKSANDASTQWEDIMPLSLPTHLRRKVFEETIDNPIVVIDKILDKLRKRLKHDLERVIDVPDNNEIHNCRMKIKIINRNIDEIVNELAVFNNSLIRQYQPWKEVKVEPNTENDNITRPIVLKKGESSIKYTPLDMECVRDSASDTENDGDVDNDIDIECVSSFSKRLVKFYEKDMINKSTNTKVETKNKAVQAYDTVTADYDKTIGYSLLMRADYDPKHKREVFKPVRIHDKFFDKYEEQFISYLQQFEDCRNYLSKNNHNKKANIDDMALNEIINVDIAAQKTAESFIEIRDDSEDSEREENPKVLRHENNEDGDVDKIMPIIESNETPLNNSINTQVKLTENENHDKDVNRSSAEMTLNRKATHEETVIAVRTLIEEESNDTNVIDKWKNTEDDDECTILE